MIGAVLFIRILLVTPEYIALFTVGGVTGTVLFICTSLATPEYIALFTI